MMLLCDIGNSSYHFYDGEKNYKYSLKQFNPKHIQKQVFYISVNKDISKTLTLLDNWIDLEVYIDKKSYYATMGIDRIVALYGLENGVVVDIGSAITVDVVKNSCFMGGYIYPGIKAMEQTYKNISPALDYSFNFELNLDKMPKNTQDAISYGYIKPLVDEIYSHGLDITLTGGDANRFKKIFQDAKIDEMLLFKAMK